jgi:hypothetical protein
VDPIGTPPPNIRIKKNHTHTNTTGESEVFGARAGQTPNSPKMGYEHLHAQTNSVFGERMRYLQPEAFHDDLTNFSVSIHTKKTLKN